MSNVIILKTLLLFMAVAVMLVTFAWSTFLVSLLENWTRKHYSSNMTPKEVEEDQLVTKEVYQIISFTLVVESIMVFGIVVISKKHAFLINVFATLLLPLAYIVVFHFLYGPFTAKLLIAFMGLIIIGFVYCYAHLVGRSRKQPAPYVNMLPMES